MKLLLEDLCKSFLTMFMVLALMISMTFAIPGMLEQAASDVEDWSGAHPDCDVEYEPLNSLPPTNHE